MQLDLGFADLPACNVRVSKRARHASVSVCAIEGIVITLPKKFDQRRVPALLMEWRPWLERQLRKIEKQREAMPAHLLAAVPARISLPSIGRNWTVSYRYSDADLRLREHDNTLILTGRTSDAQACRKSLRRWLAQRAREALAPQLAALAEQHGLDYQRLTIRGQRTRWGSYSTSGTISLNYLLMFLEPELVRCVLLHELCHARYRGHGPRFYGLLGKLEPDYQELDTRLDTAWVTIPAWAWRR